MVLCFSIDSPTPVLVAPSQFPVWLAITPAVLGLFAAMIVILIIVLICLLCKKYKKHKSVVFPLVDEEIGGITAGESKDSSELEDELELTRAMSRTVVIPEGTTIVIKEDVLLNY